MSLFLTLAYLFFIGSVLGWCLELLYRNLTHAHEKPINPGFCTGPYLPIYGLGLCVLFLLASLESHAIIPDPVLNRAALFLLMALSMTLIEFLAGLLCLKCFHLRLWDYSGRRGNIQGLICPLFSAIWASLGALYYFCIHPHILGALNWLFQNLSFSFFIGMFFGVFLVDVSHSAGLVVKLRQFARERQVIVRFEELKMNIRTFHERNAARYHFFRAFRSPRPLSEHLKEMQGSFEKWIRKSREP